ncbi:MAG: hypothetical protein AB1472_01245 [Candidatus Omnitrophota bacterium]
MIINCNIHNLLKIRIKSSSHYLIKDLNFRYHYFQDKNISNPDIFIKIGNFTPDLKDCFCLDRKFYIKKNYIYLKDNDKNLSWEAEIFDIEKDAIKINFKHNLKNYFSFPWFLFPDLIMELYILQPIIELKLAQKGLLLMHAGAVCKNNKAILVAGRGGSRKTQCIIDLLNKDFSFISDDMVVLDGAKVLSLPLSLGLFTFSYTRIKKEDMNFINQIRLFHFLSNKNNKMLSVIDMANLEKIFILFSTTRTNPTIKDINLKDAVEHLFWNQRMESTSYVSYKYIIGGFLKAYEYIFPEINFNEALDMARTKFLNEVEKNNIFAKSIEISKKQDIANLIC